MTRTRLFPRRLLASIPHPEVTFRRWIKAHSLGGDCKALDDLVIHLRLTWKFGSYFVTGFEPGTGESAGLLDQARSGRPVTLFWASWKALEGYIQNGYEFERDEGWKPITIGELRTQMVARGVRRG